MTGVQTCALPIYTAIPYPTITLPYHTIPYHYTAIPYHTLPLHCHTIPYHYTAISYSTVPYFTPLCFTVYYHTMILCTMLYRTILNFNITCFILVHFVVQYHRTINHDKTNSTMRFVYKTILALMYVYIIPSLSDLIFILSISFIPSSHNLIYSNLT